MGLSQKPKNMEKTYIHTLSDDEIIKNIKWGDSAAFEIIYDRYKNLLYNYIWTLLNFNSDEAGLVLSDVFIKAYEYIQDKNVDNFKSFLYRIAHNTAIDWIRINQNKDTKIPKNTEEQRDQTDDIEKWKIDIQYKRKLIEKYLSELDDKYKSVLYLLYYENKSYEEIAVIQQRNKNTIWTLVLQGKKKLKELILSAGIDPDIFLA